MSTREPVAAPGAVFISYSRRDYYFAESLSFRLDAAGVPTWMDTRCLSPGGEWAKQIGAALDASGCVVVVVSPDSVKSPAVHDEYRRALARGARVVLAIFRAARVPGDLQEAERVDMRGRFGAGVRRLAAAIADHRAPPTSTPGRLSLVHPPWVVAMGILLVGLWSSFIALGLATVGLDELEGWGFVALFGVVQAGVLYYVAIAFLRRRMSLTRLAVIFGVFTFIFGYPLLQQFGGARIPHIYPEPVAQFAGRQPATMATLTGLAVAGLFVLAVIRPGDLLRWSPTGRAWPRYRRRAYASRLATNPGAEPDRGAAVRVMSDAPDVPAADALRAGFNGDATPMGDDPAPVALLVTGRTRVTWVLEQLAAQPASLVTFVATGIDPIGDVGELWRRQWIDARRWLPIERPHDFYPATVRSRAGLPPLPEVLTRSVLPGRVNLTCHVALSIAALLFMMTTPERPTAAPPPSIIAEAAHMAAIGAAIVVALVWVGIAHGLLVRRDPASVFRRKVWRWGAAAIAAVIANAPFYAAAVQPAALRLAVSVVAVFAMPVAIIWLERRMTWWFPAPVETAGPVLAPARRWRRTAFVLFAHTLLWTFVLNPMD